jgi:hypothetical protein
MNYSSMKELYAAAKKDAKEAEKYAEELYQELHGPIKPLTDNDITNIVAHLSYELEPTGPLPNRNSVMMEVVRLSNKLQKLKECELEPNSSGEFANAALEILEVNLGELK